MANFDTWHGFAPRAKQVFGQRRYFTDDFGKDSTKRLPKTLELPPKGIDWKTKKDQIISSHYNLHFGHCIQLDISPLSTQKNGKFINGKGLHFMHMRLHIKTDKSVDNLYPYIFFHNGTDVDRLGENILGRELVSGKHDVSITG